MQNEYASDSKSNFTYEDNDMKVFYKSILNLEHNVLKSVLLNIYSN